MHQVLTIPILLSFFVGRVYPALCDADIFGHPKGSDCIDAVYKLPAMTETPDFYVEPQLRSNARNSDWQPLQLPSAQSKFVQLPKIWTLRSCSIALVAFRRDTSVSTASIATGHTVLGSAGQLIHDCPIMTNAGGAIIVPDIAGKSAMSLYIFDSSSQFNDALNRYQSMDFQTAMDPLHPLRRQVSLEVSDQSDGNWTGDWRNDTGLEDRKGGGPASEGSIT